MKRIHRKFNSMDEIVDFFDNNDMGDYIEQLPEANFEIKLKPSRYAVVIEPEIAEKLATIAKSEKLSVETLINNWLKEKLLSLN